MSNDRALFQPLQCKACIATTGATGAIKGTHRERFYQEMSLKF